MIERRAFHALRVFRACMLEDRWSGARLEYLSHILMSSSPSAVDDALNEIRTLIWHSQFCFYDVKGLKRMEQLLVALLGHPVERIRHTGTVLLNMFYDRHDWQHDVPFVPVIKQVGDDFEVTVSIQDEADPKKGEVPKGVVLILSAPSFDPGSKYNCYSYHTLDWLPRENTTRVRKSHAWMGSVKFRAFSRCGFYDWRVVRINDAYGSWEVSARNVLLLHSRVATTKYHQVVYIIFLLSVCAPLFLLPVDWASPP